MSFNEKLILLRLVSLDLTMSPQNFIRSRQEFVQTLAQAEANAQGLMPAEAEAKPEPKEPKEPKKAKAPSTGTMAWMAFVKHCQEAHPTRFSVKDRGHVLSVAKEIRHEDEEAYKAFVEDWKGDDNKSVGSVASEATAATAVTAATAATAVTGEKRAAHPGTLIFSAYAKHIIEKHPDLFTEAKTYGEKLKLASQMRKADEAAYEEFAKEWKEMKNTSSLVSYIQASPVFQPQVKSQIQPQVEAQVEAQVQPQAEEAH
jgi:hypothetical protein